MEFSFQFVAQLGRLPVEVASLRHCTGMLSHLTSSNPNVPNCTEGVISHAKIKDIKAMVCVFCSYAVFVLDIALKVKPSFVLQS
jgi:hypothetical protein